MEYRCKTEKKHVFCFVAVFLFLYEWCINIGIYVGVYACMCVYRIPNSFKESKYINPPKLPIRLHQIVFVSIFFLCQIMQCMSPCKPVSSPIHSRCLNAVASHKKNSERLLNTLCLLFFIQYFLLKKNIWC